VRRTAQREQGFLFGVAGISARWRIKVASFGVAIFVFCAVVVVRATV